ncbi:unnamed protein product, partial [Brenthis ino]
MSRNIVFEGWLTKSPPSKRIWRTKWRRRWFALRQSGELPGQYYLDYYADRNCRRLKGSINLDFCEQVDAGLHMERSSNCSLDPKMRGSVFTIQTQTRTYHLEADCEADMEKWVDAICRVCGLRATDEIANTTGVYQNHAMTVSKHENATMKVKSANKNATPMPVNDQKNSSTAVNNKSYNTVSVSDQPSNAVTIINDQYDCSESTGPYIPISECITGVRAQDTQRAFTFDPKDIVTSTKIPFERTSHLNQPQIKINNIELSENESNISEDECRSLNNCQSTGELTVAKSFTKMSIHQLRHDGGGDSGPPVPPRPPKTFAMSKDLCHRESFHGPKIQEPTDDNASAFPWMRQPRRMSQTQGAPPSPGCSISHSAMRTTDDDEEDANTGHSMQYWNLCTLPPAVDRALKPRHSSHSIGNANNALHSVQFTASEETKPDVLQYLDLDLQTSKPTPSNSQEVSRPTTIIHGKSSSNDEESAYKTVDFLKTEAFNITRQDAEASRSNQQ